MKKKIAAVAVAVLLAALLMSGALFRDYKLMGTWKTVDYHGEFTNWAIMSLIRFAADTEIVIGYDTFTQSDTAWGVTTTNTHSYRTDNGWIYVEDWGDCRYEVNGDELKLYDTNGGGYTLLNRVK